MKILLILLTAILFKTIPTSTIIVTPTFTPVFNQVVTHGREDRKEIALSFDADMTPFMLKELQEGKVESFYNQKIIEILHEQKIPATLFLTGLWAEAYPRETAELATNPLFEIGNHSYSHFAFTRSCFNLPLIKETDKEKEFKNSQETLKKVIGFYPNLFRFPGGCYQKKDLALAKRYGLTVVHWGVDGHDAFNVDTKKILTAVKKETKPGSILIFHLSGGKNAPQTAEALPLVIAWLKSEGYSFVTIGEMLSRLNSG